MTDDELTQTHPELMPELLQELAKLKLINQARERAEHEDISTHGGMLDQLTTETHHEGASDPPLDANVPDYNLLRRIGKGGFGEVWLGHHRLHGEYVAVKIVPKQRLVELEGVRSYKHQAKQHSHLVPIEHVGETDTCYYYVMPLADDVKGPAALRSPEDYEPKTLQWCLDNLPPMSPQEVKDLALQLLTAIDDLHRVGLMHADVKPANIMQLQGSWKLGDLGLMTRSEQLTLGRGTVAFWPPEGTTGPSADLYALGKTLYLALTNQSLKSFDDFIDGNLSVTGDLATIDQLRQVIEKACVTDPEHRIKTAGEFRDGLSRPAPRAQRPAREKKRPHSLPWQLITAIGAALLVICLLSYGVLQLWNKVVTPTNTAAPLYTTPLKNLQVLHLPHLESANQEPFGVTGLTSFWVKPGQELHVQVNMEKPTRFFIILLKSPGDMQLAYPFNQQEMESLPAAELTIVAKIGINEPPAYEQTPYCMGIMLVTLKKPLTFLQWQDQLVVKNWPPIRSKHCWFYDGEAKPFEARSRGKEVLGQSPPEPPLELVQFLEAVRENEATDQVQVTLFPVLAGHVGSRGH